MDWTATRISTRLPFERDGRHIGDLRLPYSDNAAPTGYHPIPAAVLRNGRGPTVLLVGGTHGDEFEGPTAIMRLIHELELDRLRGRVIALPALNAPALAAAARCSPLDDGNLTRAFPGARDGGPTAMIAHLVETLLMPAVDAAIDIHSGGKALIFAPCALINRQPTELYAGNRALAEAFGLPLIWQLGALNDDRSLNAAAARQGVAMMACEIGGSGGLSRATVALTLRGIRGVLAHLEIYPPDPGAPDPGTQVEATRVVEVTGHDSSLSAPAAGLFEPDFEVGEEVVAGQAAGWLHHVLEPERPPRRLDFAAAGLVLSRVNRGLVARGEKLALLATDAVP